MRNLPLNQYRSLSRLSFGVASLTALFTAAFTLTLILVIAPRFFASHLVATLAAIVGLAMIYSNYVMLTQGVRLPVLVHFIFFLFFQWMGLSRTCFSLGRFPDGMLNPLVLISLDPLWFAFILVSGMITILLNDILLSLRRIPKVHPVDRKTLFYVNINVSAESWESAWKLWRFTIFSTILVAAVCYISGKVYRDLPQSPLWAAGLFLIQISLGILLLLIGYFYYKSALWSGGGVKPVPEMKRIWRQGFTPWICIAVVASLVLPVNWRINQWWISQFLERMDRFLFSQSFTNPPVDPLQLPRFFISGAFRGDANHVNKLSSQLSSPMNHGVKLWLIILGLILFGALIGYILWRNFWQGSGTRLKECSTGGTPFDPEKNAGSSRYSWGQGPRAVIRRGYYHLIQSARRRGYDWHGSQTPQEIAGGLNLLLPDAEAALAGITDNYQQARYGPKPPSGGMALFFEQLRHKVQNQLRFLTRQK